MSPWESVFVWATIIAYALISAVFLYSFAFRNIKAINKIQWLIGVAFALHTAGITARYLAIGNLPWAGDYETALGGSWVLTVFTLYVVLVNRPLRGIGVATMPFALVLLGWGVMSEPALTPVAASVKSIWLYVHVFFAWLAFGAYAISFGIGVLYLLKEKNPDKEFYQKVPDFPKLDDYMFRYIVFGFITDAVMIAAGAVWAKDLWGKYWGWDPVETWSLVTWVIYGLAIHLRITMGWRGRKLAYLVIFALIGMVITYFGLNYFVDSSLHLFQAWQEI